MQEFYLIMAVVATVLLGLLGLVVMFDWDRQHRMVIEVIGFLLSMIFVFLYMPIVEVSGLF